jgi:hypothetical protein
MVATGITGFAFGQQNGQGQNGNGQNGQGQNGNNKAPEIDPGSAAIALALLSGGLLVIRGRRK